MLERYYFKILIFFNAFAFNILRQSIIYLLSSKLIRVLRFILNFKRNFAHINRLASMCFCCNMTLDSNNFLLRIFYKRFDSINGTEIKVEDKKKVNYKIYIIILA